MTKQLSFLSILFSLFFVSSCHYISKKSSCCDAKKRGGKYYHKYKQSKWKKKAHKKDCCGNKASVAGFSSIKSVNAEKITGSVFFERVGRYEVKVTANIKGLSPNKKFGFHVHEFGTCENKGLLAGGHLNPWGAKHAGPQARDRHLGDLGNLESDQKGTSIYSVSVKGKLNQFFGRSVIIHAKADDMKSQPAGNSGNRIACGVILASMPPVYEDKQAESESKDKKAPVGKAISSKKSAVEKAVSSKKPAVSVVEKAVSSKKPAVPVIEKAVSSKKPAVPVVEKAVSSKKPAVPVVEKAVSSKKPAVPVVEKAISSKKAKVQQTSDVKTGPKK